MADEVIDSGVVMKWFVAETYASQALFVLDRCLRDEVTLYAPDLLLSELGNILWKKRLFQGISESDSVTILDAFSVLPITLTASNNFLQDAYRLAVIHRCTFYDMLYVALSLQKGCPFLTADEKLYNAVRSHLPNVAWIGDDT